MKKSRRTKFVKKCALLLTLSLILGMQLSTVKVIAVASDTITDATTGTLAKLVLSTVASTYSYTNADGTNGPQAVPYTASTGIAINGNGNNVEVDYDGNTTLVGIELVGGNDLTVKGTAGGTLTLTNDGTIGATISTDTGNLIIDASAILTATSPGPSVAVDGVGGITVNGTLNATASGVPIATGGVFSVSGTVVATITNTATVPSAATNPINAASVVTTGTGNISSVYSNSTTPVAITNTGTGTSLPVPTIADWNNYTWAPTGIYAVAGDINDLYANKTNAVATSYTGTGLNYFGTGQHKITFYATLAASPATVNITVDSATNADVTTATVDGVTGAVNANVATGTPITITAPTANPGFVFANWTVAGTDTYNAAALGLTATTMNPTITIPAIPAAGINLTANYTSAGNYTIIDTTDTVAYPGGGFNPTAATITGAASPYTVTQGDPVTLTAKTIAGYTFLGWKDVNGNIVGATMNTAAGTMIFNMPGSNVDVQAQYTANATPTSTSTVTFNNNDGTPLGTQIINNGGMVTSVPNPTIPGYILTGWSANGGATLIDSKGLLSMKITLDITFTAMYAKMLPLK